MFALLLGLTLLASLLVCAVTIALFWWPLRSTLLGRVSEATALAWTRVLAFGVCVVGVSFGARLWDLEKLVRPDETISPDQLTLDVYKSAILTSQAELVILVVVFLGIAILAAMKRSDSSRDNP